ncbi:molybdenum cofactor guanylyltransferase [Rhodopirellula sp. P2]|uniref:molybdenum cofactor guanylyltransferase n=1 Tax=Rhodopirellula sp. P2 TaxID=2127060 RepID=UPI0023682267|nr:molybdenum cofactor guanylyltransferase [Rhodopirellula sp. P2]WDQ16134.1 molybdenum cofactor guanylyltransferase [Rhodopirellula sp. P2]
MPHAAPPRLLGVLLAGGLSSRMGTPKALLPHPGGGTFLTHSLQRLRSVCADEVVVSLASEAHRDQLRLPSSVPALFDSQPARGPAMGVWVALQHAASNGDDGCLFTPVDLPNLLADDLLTLVHAWQESPRQIVLAQQADPERLQPLVGIYPVHCVQQIQSVVESEHRSLYRTLRSIDRRTVVIPSIRLRNVNTPADLGPPFDNS